MAHKISGDQISQAFVELDRALEVFECFVEVLKHQRSTAADLV
jgi:hypothetical protein